ncbi:hypothetical protein BG262_03465 [Floricoccus penangensis]|uniref:Uncharacterized protein n=1 Tax=Floricoccus penangensis TaxID=1859475 RepID=A0A9Q5JGS2_9LACT|nr:hypothetical protein [Floricoccus penangensis]OFI46863.1 hypothetical protein BG262_03465 [Floricoccus penangensis]
MKKALKAYWSLRKNFIIGIYAIIIGIGLVGMINDQINWNSFKDEVTSQLDEKDYNKFRGEIEDLVNSGKGNNSYMEIPYFNDDKKNEVQNDSFRNKIHDYYILVTSGQYKILKKDKIYTTDFDQSAESILKELPESFKDYKNKVLNYYAPQDIEGYKKTGYEKDAYVSNSLNNVAIIIYVLAAAPLLLLVMILDQNRKFSPFYVQRGRNRNKLVFAQFIFFGLGTIFMITLMSFITHLTRGLFIPQEYVNVQYKGLVYVGMQLIIDSLIFIIYVIFIDALIGKSIYKTLTTAFSIPAAILLLNELPAEVRVKINEYSFGGNFILILLIFALILLPAAYFMNLKYSYEQEQRYVRLKKLALPFYIFIVALAIYDLIIPGIRGSLFMRGGSSDLIFVVLGVVIIVLFAKLILGTGFPSKEKA